MHLPIECIVHVLRGKEEREKKKGVCVSTGTYFGKLMSWLL